MKLKSLVGAMVALGVTVAPVAASARELVGTMTSVSGSTLVARDGRLLRAAPSMQLFKGDRVVTREGGNANVALSDGRKMAVGSSEIASVNDASSVAFQRAGHQGQSSALRGFGGGSIFVGVLALAAIVLGIIVVVDSDDDPASP